MTIQLEELKTAEYYRQQLKDIESTFSATLSNVVNAYVNTKLNPNTTEYQTTYDNILQNIHSVQSKLFELKNEVKREHEKIGEHTEERVRIIKIEKRVENEIENKIQVLEEGNPGATGLRKNLTDTYKIQYSHNFFTIIGLILGFYLLFHMFGKRVFSGEVSIDPTL